MKDLVQSERRVGNREAHSRGTSFRELSCVPAIRAEWMLFKLACPSITMHTNVLRGDLCDVAVGVSLTHVPCKSDTATAIGKTGCDREEAVSVIVYHPAVHPHPAVPAPLRGVPQSLQESIKGACKRTITQNLRLRVIDTIQYRTSDILVRNLVYQLAGQNDGTRASIRAAFEDGQGIQTADYDQLLCVFKGLLKELSAVSIVIDALDEGVGQGETCAFLKDLCDCRSAQPWKPECSLAATPPSL